jgi:mRNA interferase RelE/StbE
MTEIIWKQKVLDFLEKLQKEEANRIVKKVDTEIKSNVLHYLEHLENMPYKKIRIGNYRLFVEYIGSKDELTICLIKPRKNAYD